MEFLPYVLRVVASPALHAHGCVNASLRALRRAVVASCQVER